MTIRIALAGNPNCGKTTMFNALTGSNQYVGNWSGVTVEKKEGRLKGNKDVLIQDLPGIYSLSPYTMEEVVTRNYLLHDKPDVILNIIDGTNIERNLYLTTQLIEIGIPVVIGVNMIDIVNKNGDEINLERLSKSLGCPFVEMSALKETGIAEAVEKAIQLVKSGKKTEAPSIFEGSVEHAIAHIEESLEAYVDTASLRWYAIKVFERDQKVLEELKLEDSLKTHLFNHIEECENTLEDDSESMITNQRYQYISGCAIEAVKHKNKGKLKLSDQIDQIVTNRILALPIFAAVMFLVYYISITTVGTLVTDYTNDVIFGDLVPNAVTGWLHAIHVAPWLVGLIVDGIIGGVGAVIGFVPQMLILFLMLSVLEDCGYMARVAFIMDRIFRKFGLSGKSFIPMLIGSGCSVPGIMASRTIEQERDRRLTIMTTSFIPCGAKMPIIGLIAGALFQGAWWVATLAYFVGVAAVIISAVMLKKTKPFMGNPAPFVMELPAYHIPAIKNVLSGTWERGWSFIKRAGTVILLSAIVLWFLQGFGKWQHAVATFTGLIAKENVVSTFGVLYGFGEVSENGAEYWSRFANDFTALSAFSFMLFNLLCAPCFAAMGAIKREMNSGKWTWFAIGYLCVFAYVVAFIVYQIGLWIQGSDFGIFTVVALLLMVLLGYMVFRKEKIKIH